MILFLKVLVLVLYIMPIARIIRAITGTRRRNRVTPGQGQAGQALPQEVTAQRTARQTRRTARQGLKQIAKDYVNDIKNIRTQLKAKRAEYREAVSQNQPEAILEIIKNEFRAIARTWPRFTGNVRVQDPTARPYPEDNVIKKIGLLDKINIVKTTLLVEREINDRSRLIVAEAVLETMSPDLFMFKDGKTLFIEVKKPGGIISPLQELRQRQLREHGFTCEIMDNLEQFKNEIGRQSRTI